MILIFHLIVWKNITWLRIFLEFMIISFFELPLSEVYKVQFIQNVAIKLTQVSHCPYAKDPSVTVLVYYILCCAKTFCIFTFFDNYYITLCNNFTL